VDQPKLRRIPKIGTRNRRGGVPEGIRAVPQRFILMMEVLFLEGEIIDPKRLAPVVEPRSGSEVGTIRLRSRDK
jgi:hypothetical protein